LLLRIVAGEAEAEGTAITSTGRSRELIRQAAAFFIEQVLLHPNADSYRVLGADSQASNYELRHNMALLVKWLHPDRDPQGNRSVLANRVSRAWDDLKTPERRASYDESRRIAAAHKHAARRRAAKSTSTGEQVSVSRPRRQQRIVFVKHSLLSRVWLFLLRVARQ
jgi:curved DNA-binding protein CbpA